MLSYNQDQRHLDIMYEYFYVYFVFGIIFLALFGVCVCYCCIHSLFVTNDQNEDIVVGSADLANTRDTPPSALESARSRNVSNGALGDIEDEQKRERRREFILTNVVVEQQSNKSNANEQWEDEVNEG